VRAPPSGSVPANEASFEKHPQGTLEGIGRAKRAAKIWGIGRKSIPEYQYLFDKLKFTTIIYFCMLSENLPPPKVCRPGLGYSPPVNQALTEDMMG